MCLNISLHSDIQLTEEMYPGIRDERQVFLSLEQLENFSAVTFPPYNVIRFDKDGGLVFSTMEWGVAHKNIKDPVLARKRRLSSANARAERVLEDEKSMWFECQDNRILIPVDNIYEHRAINGWKKKVPYSVWLKGRGRFHIPGLYRLRDVVDEHGEIHTVADFMMITTEANEPMRGIHNDGENKHRMPLFVTEEMEKAWLSKKLTRGDMDEILHFKIPAEDLEFHTVYTIQSPKPRPDGRKKYEAWTWENLPPLGNDEPLKPQASLF